METVIGNESGWKLVEPHKTKACEGCRPQEGTAYLYQGDEVFVWICEEGHTQDAKHHEVVLV